MSQQCLDEWQDGMRFAVVDTTPPEARIVSQHKTAEGAVSWETRMNEEGYIVGIDADAERELSAAQVTAMTERLLEHNPHLRR